MTERKGNITVATSDIFPIIKKWLYSEHDIFLRELVANATDAITKRGIYARTKNMEIPEGKIDITIHRKDKKITLSDNGIGMTDDEIERYIAKIAFSGAEEFIQKMNAASNAKDDIIGKFGLGFFSSFMVSTQVEVDSLSIEEGSKAAKWICEGNPEYSFADSDKKEVGTTITLNVNSESEEFLDSYKVSAILRKFCDFMPYTITVYDADYIKDEQDGNHKKKEAEQSNFWTKGTRINEIYPLWKKDPATITDEEYKKFYSQLYPTDQTPLFWIHLKVDHPFTLEGILYFPKLNLTRPFQETNIKLYCKQVFVSDNCKSIIPEFLSLLKGVIDSVDIPLNVSRSSLQGDPNIKKISNYIIKKVCESLKKVSKNDRPKFETIWPDIGLFVKYGIISDEKFDEQMREHVLFKNAEEKLITLEEYRNNIPDSYKEKLKDKVLYMEKGKSDINLNNQLKKENIFCLMADDYIDPHFMQHLEHKPVGDLKHQFVSVESEIENLMGTEATNENDVKIKELFQKILVGEQKKEEETIGGIAVEIAKIKNATAPAFFKIDEQLKRYQHMAKSMGQEKEFPVKKTLMINPGNPLIQNAFAIWEKGAHPELVEKICHHVQDLATISSEGLKNEEKDVFVSRSQELIQELSRYVLS